MSDYILALTRASFLAQQDGDNLISQFHRLPLSGRAWVRHESRFDLERSMPGWGETNFQALDLKHLVINFLERPRARGNCSSCFFIAQWIGAFHNLVKRRLIVFHPNAIANITNICRWADTYFKSSHYLANYIFLLSKSWSTFYWSLATFFIRIFYNLHE